MKLSNVTTIFAKELKDTLRDRRTLIFMLAVPILAIPLLMMGLTSLMISQISKAQAEKSEIVFEGFENFPAVLQEQLRADTGFVVKTETEFSGKDLMEELKQGGFDALVVVPEAFDQAIELESPTDVEIFYDKAEVSSKFAADKVEDVLNTYEKNIVEQRMLEREISPDVLSPFEVVQHNVASMRKIAGKTVGGMLPYLIILICFMGAMYPAIDLAAGEKERGTLETLLVSPASRGDFVVGKYLVVLTTGVVAAFLSMISLVISLNYTVAGEIKELAERLSLEIDLQTGVLIFLVVLPLAGIFAAILLSVSIFAKSFKEAQSYIGGLNFLIILPAFVSLLPGIKMSYTIALIPVVNVSMILKEAISGSIEWNYVLTAFFSSLILAALTLVFAKKWFERESVLFRT